MNLFLFIHRVMVCLTDKQKIQLKGIFPGALVKRGVDWKYNDEVENLCHSFSLIKMVKLIKFCDFFPPFHFRMEMLK
jgi:hypothetical protein